MKTLLFFILLGLLSPSPFAGEGGDEDYPLYYEDMIHSDVPLWGGTDENMSPFHFADDEGIGCAYLTRLGDWRLTAAHDDDSHWYRFTAQGVFHCHVSIKSGLQRGDLDDAPASLSVFVKIEQLPHHGKKMDLWVLQMGARPGSEYLLLATEHLQPGIADFDLLQRKCPAGSSRQGPSVNGLRSDYCAINSKEDMVALAREMLALPPIGRMSLVENTDQDNQ